MKDLRNILLPACIICFSSFNSIAQSALGNQDSAFVFNLIAKADAFFSNSQYDSALQYCSNAEEFCRQKNYKKGIAYSLIKKAEILIDKEDLDKVENISERIHALGQQMNDSLVLAISTMQLAQCRMYGNKFDEAIKLFEKCTGSYFSRHPSKYGALAYNDFGYTWGQKSEYQKQADCLLNAMRIYDQLKDPPVGEIAVTLGNLSTVYYSLNDRAKAISYSLKAIPYREKAEDISGLAISCCNLSQMYIGVDMNESVKYQELCVKYSAQTGDEARILHSYITSSLIANNQKDNRKAFDFELKAINLLEKNKKDDRMLSRRYIAAGILSNELKEDSATTIGYYNKALALSKEINRKDNIRDVYNYLAGFYKAHNNYNEAYKAYRTHILYRDSIINDKTKTSIAELETKYQTEKKDKEIINLNAERRIKELQIEKQKALLAGNLLEAQKKENEIQLLSSAKELQELRIKQQDEQLEKQLLLAKTNEQQLQLAAAEKQLQVRKLKESETTRNFILAGVAVLALLSYFLFNRYQLKRKIQQQEALLAVRENIAKDLHDEIGSTLTSIKILSEVSGKNLHKDQEKTSGFIQKITEQSSAAQQGISDIVWAVNPENDKLETMVIRMREYVAQTLESKNISTSISIDERILSNTLDMKQRRDFFLIYREAVNNIAKYAEATSVSVDIIKKDNHLQLAITDNGKGFDTGSITSSNGLRNMQSRAAALKGSLQINSMPGNGTSVVLLIPAT